MKARGGVRSVPILLGCAWAAFFLHSCTAPRRALDPVAMIDTHSAPRIQVGLSKGLRVPAARVAFEGPFQVFGAAGPLPADDAAGASGYVELSIDGGLKVGSRSYAEPAVRLSAGPDAGFVLEGTRYRGDLLVVRDEVKGGGPPVLTLVNDVDLEDYLAGVVGKEMSLSKGEEALKAQVVAARTYAWYEVQNRTLRVRAGEKFDVYDDERSQVYGGRERETALAIRLVAETRGLCCSYEGRIFKTFFSSTCGGHTEPARLMLSEGEDIPPLSGTPCGHCTEGKFYRWSAEFDRAEMAKKLFGAQTVSKIASVTVTKTMRGGHALEVLVLVDNSKKEYRFHANDGFRRRIDPRAIRSTMIESVKVEGEKVIVAGKGWGHAVGMCQVGAYRLADLGWSSTRILEFYYPRSAVKKFY